MSSATLVSSSGYSPVLQPTKDCAIHQDAVVGIRRAYLQMRFSDHVPEACHLRFVPAGLRTEIGKIDDSLSKTACWTYIGERPDGGAPYHLICIGEKCLSSTKAETTANPDIQLNYLTNLLEHEVGHLRHTERDFAKIQVVAEAEKISMSAINIGEDCRIEALITKERDHQFAWDTYRDPPEPDTLSNPPNAMIAARHFAGDRTLVAAHLATGGLTDEHVDCVVTYYQQLVAAQNTVAVVGIMRRFCDAFRKIGAPPEEPAQDSGAPGSPASGESSSASSPDQSAPSGSASGGTSPTDSGAQPQKDPAAAKDKGPASDQAASKADAEAGNAGTEPASADPKDGEGSSDRAKQDPPGTASSANPSSNEKSKNVEKSPSSGNAGAEAGSGAGSPGASAPELKPSSGSATSGTSIEQPPQATTPPAEHTPGTPSAASDTLSNKPLRPEQVIGEDPNDMELSERIASQGDLLDTIMKRCFDPTAVAVVEKKPADGDVHSGIGLHTEVEYSAGGKVLGAAPWGAIDRRRVDRAVATLLQAMRGRQEIIETDRPTRRLDHRLAALGADRPYKQRIEAEQGMGPLKVVIIMDCSGSMSSECLGNGVSPISEGRHFVAVMNELAKRKRVDAILALSKVQQATAWCQAIRLPMPDKDILRITADGDGEGLAMALERLSPAIRDADMTALYTDGNITDIPIDKQKLHRKGVHLYGLYVGPDSRSPNLRTHTDYPITADSLEVLTGRYAKTLLSNRARRRVGA